MKRRIANVGCMRLQKIGCHTPSYAELLEFADQLQEIYAKITIAKTDAIYWSDFYNREAIESRIRLAFHAERRLQTEQEIIPTSAQLLRVEGMRQVHAHDKLYPTLEDSEKIRRYDHQPPTPKTPQDKAQIQTMIQQLAAQGMNTVDIKKQLADIDNQDSTAVQRRAQSFHYLPYDFIQSGFELEILKQILSFEVFQKSCLEIYYNGQRGASGFVIHCFEKRQSYWCNIGKYTTDFLIIQRDENKDKIHKVLMLETKGRGYANDPVFQRKKSFVETEFLQKNRAHFGYEKFDFLYLQDDADIESNLNKFNEKVKNFFH